MCCQLSKFEQVGGGGRPQVNNFEQVHVTTYGILGTDTQIHLKILPSHTPLRTVDICCSKSYHRPCNINLVKLTISLFKYLGQKNMIFVLYRRLAGIKIDFVVQKRIVVALCRPMSNVSINNRLSDFSSNFMWILCCVSRNIQINCYRVVMGIDSLNRHASEKSRTTMRPGSPENKINEFLQIP